jgi:phosphate uptake regulator
VIAEEMTLAPLQSPGEAMLPEVSDREIIYWLNEHLASYAQKIISLRQIVAEQDRQIEMYRRLAADFDRQKGAGK